MLRLGHAHDTERVSVGIAVVGPNVDLGRCVTIAGKTRWWVGVLGGGFDSVVNERAARMRWPSGPMRYNVAVARELPVFRPIPYVVTVERTNSSGSRCGVTRIVVEAR